MRIFLTSCLTYALLLLQFSLPNALAEEVPGNAAQRFRKKVKEIYFTDISTDDIHKINSSLSSAGVRATFNESQVVSALDTAFYFFLNHTRRSIANWKNLSYIYNKLDIPGVYRSIFLRKCIYSTKRSPKVFSGIDFFSGRDFGCLGPNVNSPSFLNKLDKILGSAVAYSEKTGTGIKEIIGSITSNLFIQTASAAGALLLFASVAFVMLILGVIITVIPKTSVKKVPREERHKPEKKKWFR